MFMTVSIQSGHGRRLEQAHSRIQEFKKSRIQEAR
jgi:hypothetical protein